MTMIGSRTAHNKPLRVLSIIIAVGACIASIVGLLDYQADTSIPTSISTMYGETVYLDGSGLYARDSISSAAQARGQDLVTLFVGVPILLIGMWSASRGDLRGKMLQAGALGYMLYTYATYSFLCMYNMLFLLYVALFGSSLFAFIMAFRSFGPHEVADALKERYPRRFLSWYLIGMGVLLALMWIARIVPAMIAGKPPIGLEHYTTLVIQTCDLAVVVPAAITTGVLFHKGNALGATLAAVLFVKLATMAAALFTMMLMMHLSGVKLSLVELVIFSILLSVGIVSSLIMFFSVGNRRAG